MKYIFIALMMLTLGCGSKEVAKSRVVAFGDSFTHGTGEDWDLPNYNWAQYVADSTGRTLVNTGIRGLQISGMLDQVMMTKVGPDDIVVFLPGINDASNYLTADYAVQNYKFKLRECLAILQYSGARVYVGTTTHLMSTQAINDAVDFYSQILRDVAPEFHNVTVVEVNKEWANDPALLFSDGHPNIEGQKELGRIFMRSISP